MEITRNDTSATVQFFGPEDDLISATFSNGETKITAVFGDRMPDGSGVAGGGEDNVQIYIDTSTNIVYTWSDSTMWTSSTLTYADGQLPVPYEFVHYCGKFRVQWRYVVAGKEYEDVVEHEVIQPLFTYEQLTSFDKDFESIGEAGVARLERIVRSVIERHTGQEFSLTKGTVNAISHNGESMALPKRMVSMRGNVGVLDGVRATIESDGWIIRAGVYANSLSTYTDHYANPIYDVYERPRFRKDRYVISGVFGYYSVPEQINLAAMLLAQDYGCRESVWRDRYVESMKSADWSVMFNEGAFAGTGNAKVDHILQSYTLNKMVVV